MSTRSFRLASVYANNRGPVPHQGEELGNKFAVLADGMVEVLAIGEQDPEYRYDLIATFYELASDAYHIGAAASIGHNRASRYEEAARACDRKAADFRERLRIAQEESNRQQRARWDADRAARNA